MQHPTTCPCEHRFSLSIGRYSPCTMAAHLWQKSDEAGSMKSIRHREQRVAIVRAYMYAARFAFKSAHPPALSTSGAWPGARAAFAHRAYPHDFAASARPDTPHPPTRASVATPATSVASPPAHQPGRAQMDAVTQRPHTTIHRPLTNARVAEHTTASTASVATSCSFAHQTRSYQCAWPRAFALIYDRAQPRKKEDVSHAKQRSIAIHARLTTPTP